MVCKTLAKKGQHRTEDAQDATRARCAYTAVSRGALSGLPLPGAVRGKCDVGKRGSRVSRAVHAGVCVRERAGEAAAQRLLDIPPPRLSRPGESSSSGAVCHVCMHVPREKGRVFGWHPGPYRGFNTLLWDASNIRIQRRVAEHGGIRKSAGHNGGSVRGA